MRATSLRFDAIADAMGVLVAFSLALSGCGGGGDDDDRGKGRDGGLPAADAGGGATHDGGAPTDAGPVFIDVAAAAGVVAPQNASPEECFLRFAGVCEQMQMTGGAAVGDVDGDGRDDVYLTRLDAPGTLYVHRGDGTFEDATARYGLDVLAAPSNGAAFLDVDEDGDLDLYVTTFDPVGGTDGRHFQLFVRRGDRFEEDARVAGVAAFDAWPRAGTSIAVGDYDLDGFSDLHVNEWIDRRLSFQGHARLFHNRGTTQPGTFEDVSSASGTAQNALGCDATSRGCDILDFASSFVDMNADGLPDLLVAGDFGHSRFYLNRGDATFDDATTRVGVATDENGMGSTAADYDNDGDVDWFVTSIGDPFMSCGSETCTWGYSGNRLYRNEGDGTFTDATDDAGVRMGGWGWGAAFFDADNDGDLDLVMTNGVDFPDTAVEDHFNDDLMRYWRNDGTGHFEEVSEQVGLTDRGSGKGLVVFDYDADGDQDILIVENAGTPRLYRNDVANGRSYLRVRVHGTHATTEGLHTIVRVRTTLTGPRQMREIGSVTHFLGQSERVAHFGLGDGVTRVAEVSLTWPSGAVTVLEDVPANQVLDVVEPE